MGKKILIALVVLILAFVGISFALPSTIDVARSTEIKADADDIYEYVGNLKKWQEWCAWNQTTYPEMKSTYSGPEEGKDAKWSWEDPGGNGSLLITSADEDKGITYDLNFEGMAPSQGRVELAQTEKITKVTMGMRGKIGMNPIHRWMMWLMGDKLLGGEFQKGLDKLKTVVEKNA